MGIPMSLSIEKNQPKRPCVACISRPIKKKRENRVDLFDRFFDEFEVFEHEFKAPVRRELDGFTWQDVSIHELGSLK